MLKGGHTKFSPCLEGRGAGGAKMLEPAPVAPLPVIHDQSLRIDITSWLGIRGALLNSIYVNC